jgi:hypothetical protein
MEVKKDKNDGHKMKLVKIPHSATREEAAKILMEATGSDIITEEIYTAIALNERDEERQQGIKKIIGKLFDEFVDKDDRESIKKKDEITDVANYLYDTGKTASLISISESPDFIVEIDGERIGIEHTGIYNDEFVAEINIFQNIFQKCEATLKENNKDAKFLFNVFVEPEKAPKNRGEVMKMCMEYFQAVINGEKPKLPVFFSKVIVSPHETLQIFLSEEYWAQKTDVESLAKLIAQKEGKIEAYKKQSGLDKISLLMVLNGAGVKSDSEIVIEELPKKASPFHEVIIYNAFDNTILVGKNNN